MANSENRTRPAGDSHSLCRSRKGCPHRRKSPRKGPSNDHLLLEGSRFHQFLDLNLDGLPSRGGRGKTFKIPTGGHMDGAERDSVLEPLKTDSPLHLERIGHPNLIASQPNSAEDPERGCLPPADQESNYARLTHSRKKTGASH